MNPFLSNGLTSDHAYQSVCISEVRDMSRVGAKPRSPMNVATWNLQDFCFSSSPRRAFANNPFNYSEQPTDYRERKVQQIRKILEYLPMEDIIFLQEADFLFASDAGHNPHVVDPALKLIQQQLAETFRQGLAERHFEIILSPQNFVRGCGSQKLVTLFDKRRFDLCSSDVVFLTDMDSYQMHRGLEAVLLDKKTGFPVIATNVHLKYGVSPVKAIQAYQSVHHENLCIIGGDTNHVDEQMLALALGDYTYATNFSCNKQKHLTTVHEGTELTYSHEKSYDRFFVTPSLCAELSFWINAKRSEIVKIIDGQPMMNILEQAWAAEKSEDQDSAFAASFDAMDIHSGSAPSFFEPNLMPASVASDSPIFYSPRPQRPSDRLRENNHPVPASHLPWCPIAHYHVASLNNHAPSPQYSPEATSKVRRKRQGLPFVRIEEVPPSSEPAKNDAELPVSASAFVPSV